MKIIVLVFVSGALVLLPNRARCDEGFYASGSAGVVFGPLNLDPSAFSNGYAVTPSTHSAFSPSFSLGYSFQLPLSIELGYTGDGKYNYYGSWEGAEITGQEYQYLTASEKLSDVALRLPFRFTPLKKFSVELIPGVERQELQVSETQVYGPDLALVFPPRPVTSETSSGSTARWALEAGIRGSYSLNQTFSLVLGYRYTTATGKSVSSLSLGLAGRF